MDKIAEEKFLKTARERFKQCVELEDDNRKRALAAIKFRDLEQWPDNIKNSRDNDVNGARPCLTIDKVNQYVRQVCNDQRQNRPQIKVRPNDDVSDPETAEIFNGIIRNLVDQSCGDIAFDTAFEQAADGGYGYFRVLTEYQEADSFKQTIAIKRVRNRFSIYLSAHQEPDGSDADHAFVTERISKDEYQREYPQTGATPEWEDAGMGDASSDWYDKDDLRIAEYFYTNYEPVEIVMLESGHVVEKSVYDDINITDRNILKPDFSLGMIKQEIIKARTAMKKKIKWAKITGATVLEEREWAGKWIPIIKVSGVEIDIEGKLKLSGMVRPAIDSCRMYNYAASAFVEMVALAPKAPWVAADGQVEDHADEWNSANRINTSVLRYKPITIDGVIVPAPQRVALPGVPQGWGATMQFAENDIQGNMGMYKAALGAPSAETSGRAILAKQRESDSSTFHLIDNLSRSLIHCGRILVDLIPKIYDTEMIARILGEDGTHEAVKLNPAQLEAMRQVQMNDGIKKIYNLGVGKYDVTVSTGPSYTTKRAEAAEGMVNIIQTNPNLMQTHGDLLFHNLDWPGADEMEKRSKKMLPPELQDNQENDPETIIAELQGQLQQQAMAMEEMQKAMETTEKDMAAVEQAKVQLQTLDNKIMKEADKVEMDKERIRLEKDSAVIEIKKELMMLKNEQEKLGNERVMMKLEAANIEKDTQLSQRETEVVNQVSSPLLEVMRNIEVQIAQSNEERSKELQTGLAVTTNVMSAVIDKMTQALTAPKKLVRDSEGRPTGVVTG